MGYSIGGAGKSPFGAMGPTVGPMGMQLPALPLPAGNPSPAEAAYRAEVEKALSSTRDEYKPDAFDTLLQFGLGALASSSQPGANVWSAIGNGGLNATQANRSNRREFMQDQALGKQDQMQRLGLMGQLAAGERPQYQVDRNGNVLQMNAQGGPRRVYESPADASTKQNPEVAKIQQLMQLRDSLPEGPDKNTISAMISQLDAGVKAKVEASGRGAGDLQYAAPIAEARAGGAARGTQGAEFAPAPPNLPNVPPGMTAGGASTFIRQTATNAANQPNKVPEIETDLRKEFVGRPEVSRFLEVRPLYAAALSTADSKTKAADLNLIYAFGKLMDPGSVVREGEMVMVNNTSPVADILQRYMGQLTGDSALTEATRNSLLREMRGRYNQIRSAYGTVEDQYRRMAGERGAKPENVITQQTDVNDSFLDAKPAAPAPNRRGQAPNTRRLRYNPETGNIE